MRIQGLLALALLAACSTNDDVGIFAVTSNTGSVNQPSQFRVAAIRGSVFGTGGQAVSGATVTINGTASDSGGSCNGATAQVIVSTGTTGEFRGELRVPSDVLNICVTVTAVPPVGSRLQSATVDAGRMSPALQRQGTPVPERTVFIQLSP
jgi:hypothetical protein